MSVAVAIASTVVTVAATTAFVVDHLVIVVAMQHATKCHQSCQYP